MNLPCKHSKPGAVFLIGSAVLFSIGNLSLATAQAPSAPAQTLTQGIPPQARGPREPLPPIVPADTLSSLETLGRCN